MITRAGSSPWPSFPPTTRRPWRPRSTGSRPRAVTAVSLPETPYGVGLPAFDEDGYWDPVFAALCDHDMAMCLHIGGAFGLLQRAKTASPDNLIIMSPQLSAVTASDLMVGGRLQALPRPSKVAMSEGGIGWIPFFLDRMDRHMWNHRWTGLKVANGKTPTELWRTNFLGCFITDPVRPAHPGPDRDRDHRLGVRLSPLRFDLAPLSRAAARRARSGRDAATTKSTPSPGRTPAGSSASTRSPPSPATRRPWGRCGPGPPTSTSARSPRTSTAAAGKPPTRPPEDAAPGAIRAGARHTRRHRSPPRFGRPAPGRPAPGRPALGRPEKLSPGARWGT